MAEEKRSPDSPHGSAGRFPERFTEHLREAARRAGEAGRSGRAAGRRGWAAVSAGLSTGLAAGVTAARDAARAADTADHPDAADHPDTVAGTDTAQGRAADPAAPGRTVHDLSARARAHAALPPSAGPARAHAGPARANTGAPWVQVNLAPERDPDGRPRCYEELATVAREFLASDRARNFFFMHKEPGIRVRFQAVETGTRQTHGKRGQTAATALRTALQRRLGECEGLRRRPVCTVYEPEHYLFGGPASMTYVHDLFTLDSLAWLDHHINHPRETGPSVGWRFSLLMLREVFAGLGIVGWEHRGVWDFVARQTGRRLHGATADIAPQARQRAAAGIVAYWYAPLEDALRAFPQERAATLRRHGEAVRRAATRWREGYFEAGEATIGPRAAAGYYTVFHWNRGLLSLARQSLLAGALSGEGRDTHAATAPTR